MMRTIATALLAGLMMTALLAALEPPPQLGGRRLSDYPWRPSPRLFRAARAQADPPPRHDKYRDDPHAACVTPAVAAYSKNPSLHPCTCTLMCAEGAGGYQESIENPACELYCTKERCGCHPEEPCDAPPDVQRAPKDGR